VIRTSACLKRKCLPLQNDSYTGDSFYCPLLWQPKRDQEPDWDKYDDRDGVDHSHYGDDVLRALSHYRSCRLAYEKLGKYKFKIENTDRLDAVQNAFDALVKARKRETGIGYYLTLEQYNQLKD